MRIILIVADTFRYDHIGSNGLVNVSTPEIDDLIEDSVFFERTYAGSFPTVPHRFDMLTGTFGFPYRGWEPIGPKDITMGEILLDYGYVTQLITDAANLLRRELNYDRGYIGYYLTRGQERDIYFTKMNEPLRHVIPVEKARHTFYFGDHPTVDLTQWINSHWRWEEDRFAPTTAKISSRWIEANYREENFFLHVDFFDPHEPWDPPRYFVDKYADPGYRGTPMIMPNYGRSDVFTREELHDMHAHYKAEVEMVSKWIGYLIRKIKDVGIYDESLIIFTSDHGIYVGEHQRTGKINISKDDPRGPWPLYEEITRVPLAIKMPGQQFAGNRIEEIIQPPDILPTILELAGIDSRAKLPGKSHLPDREVILENPGVVQGREYGLPDFDGRSLLPLIRGESTPWHRDVAITTRRMEPFVTGGMAGLSATREDASTLLWVTVTGRRYALLLGGKAEDPPELYDLEKDPKQENNIYSENRGTAKEMADALFAFAASAGIAHGVIEAYRSKLP